MNEPDILMRRLIVRLRSIGIPVSEKILPEVKINTRAKRRLGCCIYTEQGCQIEVSERLLAADKTELLEETLVHELLHTCYGCRNHGDRWKAYAKKASDIFGYNIKRTVELDETDVIKAEVRYVLVCEKCGANIERMRMSKAVKYPGRYRCKCGGTLKSFYVKGE